MFLPELFVKRTKDLLGEDFPELKKALESTPPISIRVNNKMKYVPSEEHVSWCESGYYLKERPLFTADPFLHAGIYYVQEASSTFLYQAVMQHFPDAKTVLDLCAAPGGKSTLLTQTLPETSLLVSNEIIRSRAFILAENLIKWGNPNVVVTNNEPKDFDKLPGFFDAIVVDAPCSGEGMFRKDAGAIEEWSEYNVKLCALRQREILTNIWDSLKTDGILVYSTCTFNREENEDNVSWICKEIGADLLRINLNGNENITTTDFGYRFYPHKTKGEGFFISVLQKKSAQNRELKIKKADLKGIKQLSITDFPSITLTENKNWEIILENNRVNAYDKLRIADYLFINKHFKCLYSGLLLGEMKGSDFIPSINIALSKKLDKLSVETAEVDYNTAIAYLKKETIQLPDSKQGYILICYKGQSLGWVKNLGNRCNNMYPHEWRIRMNL